MACRIAEDSALRWPVAEMPMVPSVVRTRRCDLREGFEGSVCEAVEERGPGGGALTWSGRCEAPGRLEGIADGADAGCFGDTRAVGGRRGEDVGVFVGVEVGDVDAGCWSLLDLGEGFAGDVGFADLAAQGGAEKSPDEWGGSFCRRGRGVWGWFRGGESGVPSVRTTWQPTPSEGLAWAMATASSKAGPLAMRVAEVRRRRVELGDGAVDAAGEAEVVCVDDEAGGHEQGESEEAAGSPDEEIER
jgi:hypothetical protein